MERDILFRGKDERGLWFFGSLHIQKQMCEYDDREIYYINTNYHPSNPSFIEVIPETVGQMTDIIDINGDYIFEGDVVNQFSSIDDCENISFTGKVVFDRGSWRIDNGETSIPLWHEYRDNKVLR